MTTFDLDRRAAELFPQQFGTLWSNAQVRAAAIQLAREAADARAEEVALELDRRKPVGSSPWASDIARSTIAKPETREARLERALHEIRSGLGMTAGEIAFARCQEIAHRALERP